MAYAVFDQPSLIKGMSPKAENKLIKRADLSTAVPLP